MVEQEADDALAAAAVRAAADPRVDAGAHLHARQGSRPIASSATASSSSIAASARSGTKTRIVQKFGVRPASIPDYLALVGDSADGFPGLPGWGARSAAGILSLFEHLGADPRRLARMACPVRNAAALARTLTDQRELAYLFRDLATLRTDAPVFESVDELEWKGPRPEFAPLMKRLDAATQSAAEPATDRGRPRLS